MADGKNKKISKFRIILYFYLVLFLLLLITTATYTWFSFSTRHRASNMAVYINTPTGMQISLTPQDTGEWGQHINFADLVSGTSKLRPATWSEKDQRFYAAVYNYDGRLTGLWEPLSDQYNTNRDDYEGFYCVGTFYARTDDKVQVSLSPAVAVDGGVGAHGTYLIGAPLWDSETVSHSNGGEGAENAVRVGIKITRLDSENNPLSDEAPLFFIYEPNADVHADGSTGYVATPSIDGTETLIPANRIFAQTATSWEESDPINREEVVYSFGKFLSDPKLFIMDEGEKIEIKVYIWLEGQDVDCINANMANDVQLFANLQFSAISVPDSGLDGIEGEENEDEDIAE